MNLLFTLFTLEMIVMLSTLFMMFRNNNVFNFRERTADILFAHAREDIKGGREWRWRVETYKTVSYNYMVFHFWKRLKPESFWEDTSFLES